MAITVGATIRGTIVHGIRPGITMDGTVRIVGDGVVSMPAGIHPGIMIGIGDPLTGDITVTAIMVVIMVIITTITINLITEINTGALP